MHAILKYQLTLAVIFGIGLRFYQYALRPVVWHDEAMMIINALRLSYSQMLGPLLNAEAAPPLYLVMTKVIVDIFGDSEFSLRAIPVLTSCGSVVAVAGFSKRVMSLSAATTATLLFASSERLLWHACETKSYSVDVLIAAFMAYAFIRTAHWPLAWRCFWGALIAPILIWSSFPACFVLGGVLVGLLPACWTERHKPSAMASYLAFAVSVGVSFILLAIGPAAAQRNPELESFWLNDFPNTSRPLSILPWAAFRTLQVMRYAIMPHGFLFVINVAVAAVSWWRHGKADIVTVLLLPIVLVFVASLLGKYPYCGSRLLAFTAPAICILTAEGLRIVIAASGRIRMLSIVTAVILVLVPVGLAVYRTVKPWPRAACDEATTLVLSQRQNNEMVLVNCSPYEYYLRHKSHWRLWYGTYQDADLTHTGMWVLHTAEPLPKTFPFVIPADWELINTYELRDTKVYHLKRMK